MNDLLVNLAPTGVIPTRSTSDAVPLTPTEVVADVLACAERGLTTVHLHARDDDGRPTWRPEPYAEMIEGIRSERPDLVIGVSCSGRSVPEIDKRAAVLDLPDDLRPDMASLTLSSLNFARSASVNAPDTVRGLAERMNDRGIIPELEVFDLGMVNYAKYLIGRGVLRPPHLFNLFFGNVAGAQAELLDIAAMVQSLPDDSLWSGAGIGSAQLPVHAIAIAVGDGVRVGLEDALHLDPERQTPASNLTLLERVHRLAAVHGRAIMTPNELRARLTHG
ncbi:MAG: 3-keto-5-aminohexanoate cleavage protein [Acidimicrobiales bacterium]|nr:3-keto-5-aminohexanoate cleavage protein [Acidimicrobiales bacterium]